MTKFGKSSDSGGFKAASGGETAKNAKPPAVTAEYAPGRISITKIIPPKSEGAYPRSRLFRLLDSNRRFPVTWISGPAGSGKTTLVASYLSHRELPAIWYRVDEGDADIATFFYYMGLAAKKASPRKRKPLPLFAPAYFKGVSAFTLRYFEHLYSRVKPSSVLVFDNYQHVPAKSEFHEVICSGLDILPEEVRVIVISRETPPPQFARLRVNGKIAFLADELFFTLEESREMMRLKVPGGLTDQALRRMHETAKGWAAGLVLMAENSPKNGSGCQSPARHTSRELFEYFATEIFEKMDRETRDFLLKTAFLPGMAAGMAEQLTGISRSGEILSRLHRNHFFTERNTQTVPVYRYHPLFREFLLSKARTVMQAEDLHRIRHASAALLAADGRIEDAAELFVSAGEWTGMTGLILEHARSLIGQGRSRTVETWLGKLPGDMAGDSPWLLYWRGVCRIAQNPFESRGDFEAAFHGFRRTEDLTGMLLAWSGVVDSILFAWDDFKVLDPWIDWLDDLMKCSLSFPSPEIEARVCSSLAGALGMRFPFRPGIKDLVERALSLSRQVGDVNLHLTTMHNAALYYVWTGNFAALDLLSRRTREIVKSADDSLVSLLFWSSAEPIRKEVSPAHYDGVIPVVRKGLDLAEKIGVHVFDYWFYAHGVYGAFNIRDFAKADEFLRQMEAVAEKGPRQAFTKYQYLLGWYHFLQGNIPCALASVEKSLAAVLETGIWLPEIPCRHLMAILLQAKGENDSALDQIRAAKDLAVGLGKEGFYFWFCLLTEARFRLEGGDENQGLELLGQAMTLGRKRGYMTMVFCWQPSVMAELCRRALEAGIEPDYVRDFVRTYRLVPDKLPVESEKWPWPVKVRTLGRFEIMRDGQLLEFKGGKAPRKIILLLKAIIAFGGKGADEAQLADLLWPDADGDTARKSLHTSLHRLRKLLGNEKALLLRDGRIRLEPEYCRVDAHAFEELLGQAESGLADARFRQIGKAVRFFRGAFLEGADEPWALSYRERLRNKYLRAVLLLGDHLEKAANLEEAVDLYRAALEIDDLAEELYRRTIRCLHTAGRRAEAIAVYQRCETMLRTVLGVAPSSETRSLYQEVTGR
jgi:LuxR family maltose regulon positive regulatory protein